MRAAIVVPRFGPNVLGGAESLSRGLAAVAAGNGWTVEIWTTCSADNINWQNEYLAGVSQENGYTIRRFAVDDWNQAKFHRLNQHMHRYVDLPVSQQYEWIISGPHSSALNQHIKEQASEFDIIIVMPYLASVNYDAAILAGDNVVLWPCLHNEIFAHMEPFRLLLESVYAVVFISPEEARFATQDLMLDLLRSTVIGSGVVLAGNDSKATKENTQPYLLYVGRLEHGKNVPLLYEFVGRYVKEGGLLRLVVAGNGPCPPPAHDAFVHLGSVTEEHKGELYAGSLALCQPSENESFSLVIMESWLAGRPALVWSECEVTRSHVQRSKGGLWFGNYAEFKATVDWLQQHEIEAARMGSNGRRYVEQNFTWQRVFEQFESALAKWRTAGAAVKDGS